MTDHYRKIMLGLLVEAIGVAPVQVSRLESIFQAGVGHALMVSVGEIPADDQTLIRNLADRLWTMVHAVGLTPIQVSAQAFGFAERCGYAALWYELTTAGLTSDAWIAVLRGLCVGPSDATRGIACTTALTALVYAERVDGRATPHTRLAACQDAICAIAYLHLVDAGQLRADHGDRQPGAPVWGHLPIHRMRSLNVPPGSVLEEARLAGYPPTLAVLCFTLRVLDIPLPAYRTAGDVVFVSRDQTVVATTSVEATDQVVAPAGLADDDAALALVAYNALCLQRLLAAAHDQQMVNDLPRRTPHGCLDRRAAYVRVLPGEPTRGQQVVPGSARRAGGTLFHHKRDR